MTTFLRLVAEKDKSNCLLNTCSAFRTVACDSRIFQVPPESFRSVPGTPFAYWVSESVRAIFKELPQLEHDGNVARRGVNSNDDNRFIRLWWEAVSGGSKWEPHVKGGAKSPFYADPYLIINWNPSGRELEAERVTTNVYKHAIVPSKDLYFRPGLTWPLRTSSRLTVRAMPYGCVFGSKGPAILVSNDAIERLLALLALANSLPFYALVQLQLAAADAAARAYEVGVIQQTPIPVLDTATIQELAALAGRAWLLKRTQDTINETSHAFLLPALLRSRLGTFEPVAIEADLAQIHNKLDTIAFALYGFTEPDRNSSTGVLETGEIESLDDEEEAEGDAPSTDTLLSWIVGVAVGRFDWRLATGEREIQPEPAPFDPLPAKSHGMLPDGATPFHTHHGILVDDPGHLHDLVRLVEEVLVRVNANVTVAVRRWLQRDFFSLHLKQYSKSRRKAPIYWPLSTSSGSYTLWLYYPSLTNQTLYTAINDFIEPKLKQVGQEVISLRSKGRARSRDEEKEFEALQSLETELAEFRSMLLEIAPIYHPNHDDGVQITAAPLWRLFRHRPWQKLLKDTWGKLEKGDYDWARLAMAYWPERVQEKCRTDKSLAIAHDLEHLYEEPAENAGAARGSKRAGGAG